uniref:Uncharacterized protein n=1 Tax=Graphocephala atropunctata TaxID=36148 RepID=A0A1B6L406_9HEMI
MFWYKGPNTILGNPVRHLRHLDLLCRVVVVVVMVKIYRLRNMSPDKKVVIDILEDMAVVGMMVVVVVEVVVGVVVVGKLVLVDVDMVVGEEDRVVEGVVMGDYSSYVSFFFFFFSKRSGVLTHLLQY